ncbi:hypothetical protein B0H66DRAFT_608382 [Apodospora peruviana]|uniref:MARVEL domain-containing protein n=1 Tax=Apodospora peruviana TaxID=516989 RepID=A0AAE0HSI2_9PEZI|nr:hypothetical protein B0H66DRAFT_608382 [Apodospora peruviana]
MGPPTSTDEQPGRHKSKASRGFNVFLQLGELTYGAIVLGTIGRALDLIDDAGSQPNVRLVFTVVIASLTIIFSLFFILPKEGYYWGRWYRTAPVGVDVDWSECSAWRTVLAFSFVAMFTCLLSFILWVIRRGRVKQRGNKLTRTYSRKGAPNDGVNGAENGYGAGGGVVETHQAPAPVSAQTSMPAAAPAAGPVLTTTSPAAPTH